MSLKTRERVRPLRFFFSRALKLNSELGPGGPLFHELENKKRIKTLTGLFFTIIKIEGFVSYVFLVDSVQSLLILMTFLKNKIEEFNIFIYIII